MYFGDDYNSRVLVYDFVKITKDSLTSGTTGSSYSQTISTQNDQGTLHYSITSGSLPSGLTLNSSTGVLSGIPTTAGSYSFTIKVTDTPGNFGSFFDTKSYVLSIAQGQTSSSSTPQVSKNSVKIPAMSSSMEEEEVASADTITNSNASVPVKTTPTVPAPKSNQENNDPNFSIVWWGVGGVSVMLLLVAMGVVATKVSKA